MKIDLMSALDYLASATIEHTHSVGHTTVNVGTSERGLQFIMLTSVTGEANLTEAS